MNLLDKFNTINWSCHICGKVREDRFISVRSNDVSKKFGLNSGSITENIRYCNDTECLVKVENFTFFEDKTS